MIDLDRLREARRTMVVAMSKSMDEAFRVRNEAVTALLTAPTVACSVCKGEGRYTCCSDLPLIACDLCDGSGWVALVPVARQASIA